MTYFLKVFVFALITSLGMYVIGWLFDSKLSFWTYFLAMAAACWIVDAVNYARRL